MMKKLKELFNENHLWITLSSVQLIGEWTSLDNTTAVDYRIYDFFGDKIIDRSFEHLTDAQFTSAVADFINSQVYELDKLFATTEAEYDPIQNYSMTETGTDVTTASSEGDTTDYSTSYNSSSENKTGKSEASGQSNTSLTHNFTRSGNIGVTTSQQMLQSERDIAHFDFIGYVAELIVTNFTSSQYFPEDDLMAVIL